jgi:hypothetical protein
LMSTSIWITASLFRFLEGRTVIHKRYEVGSAVRDAEERGGSGRRVGRRRWVSDRRVEQAGRAGARRQRAVLGPDTRRRSVPPAAHGAGATEVTDREPLEDSDQDVAGHLRPDGGTALLAAASHGDDRFDRSSTTPAVRLYFGSDRSRPCITAVTRYVYGVQHVRITWTLGQIGLLLACCCCCSSDGLDGPRSVSWCKI